MESPEQGDGAARERGGGPLLCQPAERPLRGPDRWKKRSGLRHERHPERRSLRRNEPAQRTLLLPAGQGRRPERVLAQPNRLGVLRPVRDGRQIDPLARDGLHVPGAPQGGLEAGLPSRRDAIDHRRLSPGDREVRGHRASGAARGSDRLRGGQGGRRGAQGRRGGEGEQKGGEQRVHLGHLRLPRSEGRAAPEGRGPPARDPQARQLHAPPPRHRRRGPRGRPGNPPPRG